MSNQVFVIYPIILQSIHSTQKIAFEEASLLARLERLLFSEHMSDVVFEVGTSSKELIHAHKVILTLASEVFFAQFNGNFAESNQDNRAKPIVVPDIKPAAFREVMRYIYTEKFNITGTNAIDLFYAAQKYMMNTLKEKCESFLKTPGNETKVLEAIDSNTKYGLTEMNQLCLRLIQENPILYFNSDDFISLSKRTIGMIAGCETMNCKTEHIHNAIEKWRKANNVSEEFKIELKDLQCHKLHFFGNFSYLPPTGTFFKILVERNLQLYGVGIFVGKDPKSDLDCNEVTITVQLGPVRLTKEVPLKDHLYIEEIFFQKVTVTKECSCSVEVAIAASSSMHLFYLGSFLVADQLNIRAISRNSNNCVAYLLYNVDE